MQKLLLALCVSLLLLGGLVGSADAYTVEARYFIDGVDLNAGDIHANPAVLLIIVGGPDEIEKLLKPSSTTLESFESWVDIYFEYDPAAGMYAIAVRDDDDNTNVAGMAVLDDQTIIDNMNDISFDPFDDGFHTAEINPLEEMVLLRTEDERYFRISNFVLSTWSVSFEVLELTEYGQVIPEPSTLLLIGLGLLGLMGIRRWKRKGKGIIKVLLVVALVGGVLLSGAEPVAAQSPYDCSPSNQTEIPQTECEALVALYNSTNDPSTNDPVWADSTNWNTQSPDFPCDWFGVTCYVGQVVQLNLSENQLNGTIPPALGNLSNVHTLYLNDNQLEGSIPRELGNLTNSTYLWLDLSHNQLSGSIPRELGNLTNLYWFDLSHNQLSESIPRELGNLTNVGGLWLSHNQLSGSIPPELGNLTFHEVGSLLLDHNKLSGPIPPELGNPKGMSALDRLTLNDNNLSGPIPPELGQLEVGVLSLANNPELQGPLPKELMDNSVLWQFYFNGTNLCEPQDTTFQTWLAGIGEWQGTGVACLFQATDIPQAEADALIALYKSTDGDNWANKTGWLDAGSSPCDWYGVTCDTSREHVIQLLLNDNDDDGSNGSPGNNLTGSIPPEFGNLTWLQTLLLNNNQLSGSLPANLNQLTALTTFNFSNTNLCEPQELQNWLTTNGFQGTNESCISYFAEGDWQDANKTEAEDDDDDLCWAAAAANILEWSGWDTETYDTATEIMDNYEAHWENKKGSAQDAWKWWLTGAEPGDFGEYSAEWAHVDVPGGGDYWPGYDFNDWYYYSDQMSDIPWLLESEYGVTLTLASDLADPSSVHAAHHAITLWGWEEYDNMITDLWVTDSDDLAGDLFRLQVMQYDDGSWYLGGGDLNAPYGYATGEWYIDEIHALKQKSDLRITAESGPHGTIWPEGEVLVPGGENQAFTMTPESGYNLLELLVDGTNVLAGPVTGPFEYTLENVTTNHTIKAVFTQMVMITAIAGPYGTIAPEGNMEMEVGTSPTFTITPDSGYQLLELLVDGTNVLPGSVNEPYEHTFENVDINHTIEAYFLPANQMVTITASAYTREGKAPGGSISPAGNVKVEQGQNQEFSMTPDDRYQFVDVFVKKPSETIWTSVRDADEFEYIRPDRYYTFNSVSEDQEIKVRFAKKEETIIEIQGRCEGPYGQDWECSKVKKCVDDAGEMVPYQNGTCPANEIDENISVSIDNEEYDLATGFRVSLSEAYALFLEYQGQDFKAWEQCETHERFKDGIAYTEETLCVSAALSFGPGCRCGD